MFSNIKELARHTFTPIHLMPGDKLVLTHNEPRSFKDRILGLNNKVLCETTITADQAMTFDEAVLIEGEYEGRRALGGIVLEQK